MRLPFKTLLHHYSSLVPYGPSSLTLCCNMLTGVQFAQELLSTFSTSLGEIALIPSTGGVFIVDLTYSLPHGDETDANKSEPKVHTVQLWE